MKGRVMSNLPALRGDTIIARLETANAMLAEADTISKTKAVVDISAAAEVFATRQKLGDDAINYAHSIKIEALRQMGAQLKAAPKNKGRKLNGRDIFGGTRQVPPKEEPPTLEALGVDKKTSAMAQKLADLPEKDFEAVRDGHESIGKAIANASERKAKNAAPTPKPDKPLEHESANASARIKELADRIVELEADLADMTEKRDALGDEATSLSEFKANSEFEAMQRLRLEVRSLRQSLATCNANRNQLLGEVKMLRKKLDKK